MSFDPFAIQSPSVPIEQVLEPLDQIALGTEGIAEDVALVPAQVEAAPDDNEEDALVVFGSAVKALGSGRIGGYLVLFSDESNPDLTGDFFTKETDFGAHETSLVYYQHGQDGALKRRVLDPAARMRKDDVGVWVEAQLALRDEYERKIEELAAAGKLGWSSGTAPHLVERVPRQKAAWIKTWPLGLDASLTPNPAEPRTRVLSLKTLPPLFDAGDISTQEEIMGDTQPTTATQPGADVARLAEQVTDLSNVVKSVRSDLDDIRSMPAVKSARSRNPLDAADELGGAYGGGLNARAGEPVHGYHYFKALATNSYPGKPTRQTEYPEGVFGGFIKAVFSSYKPSPSISRDAIKALDEVYGASADSDSAKALGTQAGVSGAYTIPEQFIPTLMQIARQNDVLYGRTMVIPADGGEIVIPALDHSGSYVEGQSQYYGGVTVSWGTDDADPVLTDPRFKQVRLKTNAMKALTRIKNQLMMRSAVAIDAVVSQLLGSAIGRARDYAILRGTGQGQPLGVLNSPATIDVGGSAIDFATLAGMEDNVIPERDDNYVWIIHSKKRSAIWALQQTNNTLVTLLPNLRDRPTTTLLGRPIAWTDKTPFASGDVSNTVNLIDPSMIVVAEFQGIALAVSDQARFEQDETVIRAIMSIDAQPWLTNKIAVTSTPDYVSGFITI